MNAAPLFLFLHGFPDSPSSWQAQREHLLAQGIKNEQLLAPALDARLDLSGQRVALQTLIDKADPSGRAPLRIIAHDLGVLHAWELAPFVESRLRGLFLLNGVNLVQMSRRLRRNPRQLLKSWYVFCFQLPRLPELSFEWMARRKLPNRDMAEIRAATPLIAHYRAAFRALPSRLRHPLPIVKAPVWMVASTRDAYLEPPTVDEVRGIAERPQIHLVEGKHWVQSQEPAKINALLDRFVRESEHGHA